jgi:hypothetical protein
MSRTLLLTTVLLLTLAGDQPVTKDRVQQDDAISFIAAVLRADGTLVPFAQYGNGGWTNPWPKPRQPAESIYAEATEVIPHSLGNLPEPWFKQCGKVPNKWYVWSTLATPLVLNAGKVLQVENHSQKNWALTTNFPSPSANDGHHRNVGIAVSVNKRVETFVPVQTDTAEAAEINSFVQQISAEARNAKLKSLYRSMLRVNNEYLYYFEAEKQHERATNSNDPGCNDISIFQGWITADERGGMGLLASRKFLTDCNLKGPSFTTPLGLLRLNNTPFLFAVEHGWEDESYLILELDNSGLHKVLETFGG